MPRFDEYFNKAFSESFESASKMAFEKWKEEKMMGNKNLETYATMLNIRKNLAEMGLLGNTQMGNMPSQSQVVPQVLPQQGVPPQGISQIQGQGVMPSPIGQGNIPLIPIGSTINQYGVQTKTDLGFDPIAKKIQEETVTLNLKRSVLRKDLTSFFSVDDVIQRARGKGWGRFGSGAQMFLEGVGQNTTLGRAVAVHDATSKRLRVQLVRAAGDVGALNIVEQKAAEEMVPSTYDDSKTAQIKRAYLKQISKAIDDESEDEVKKVMDKFLSDDVSSIKKFVVEGKSYYIPNAKVKAFKQAKGIK